MHDAAAFGRAKGPLDLSLIRPHPFVYEFHSLLIQAIVAILGAVIVLLAWNAIGGRR